MSHNVHGTFISEKPNKIRWRPDPFNNPHSFLTGSWDNDRNNIKLWDFQEKEDDPDIFPYVVSNFPFQGDVTELKFLNPDYFVASSTSGSVFLLKVSVDERSSVDITEEIKWNGLHYFGDGETSPCTSFAVYDNDVVSIGEDGRVNLLSAHEKDAVRVMGDTDSCSLTCVIFVKFNEILTGNLRGQMKIWDLRASAINSATTFMLSGDQASATSLTCHPTQRHMIVAGDEDGSLTVWDLRHNAYPLNLLSAHDGSVSELQFNPEYPDQLFSCSSAGELWHWTVNKQTSLLKTDEGDMNPWIIGDAIKNKLEVYALMPKLHKCVNSLDLNRNRVLCGCDNEAIYLINGLNVYN